MVDKDDWRTQWLHALGTIVAVAAVIGTVLGALTYGAVRVTGLAGEETEAQDRRSSRPPAAAGLAAARPRPSTESVSRAEHKAARPDRRRPVERKAERAQDDKRDRAKPRDRNRAAERAKARRHRAHRARERLTLVAGRHRVQRMQRVNLRGGYPGHAGTRLVVQRLERGRWQRFPVTVVVRSGRFRTWIASGRPGPNRLRVLDTRTRRASPPVTVRVR